MDEVVDNIEAAAPVATTAVPTENSDWRSSLPEEMRGSESLSKFSSVEALAGSYTNLERMIGRDKIPMPKSEDEWSQTYDRLGRPKDAGEYKFDLGDLKDKVGDLGPEDDQWFREAAHKMGLNQDQAQGLYNEYWQYMDGLNDQVSSVMANNHANSMNELTKDWLGNTEKNIEVANRALEQLSEDVFGDNTFIDHIKERGLDNDPVLAKVLFHIGKSSMEESGLTGSGSHALTSDGINTKISDIQKSKPYTDKHDPGHAAAVREMSRLFEALHPE